MNPTNTWKDAVRRWAWRYGPPEIIGTAIALLGYLAVDAATGNPIAAAYGASLGEVLGFYGTFMLRSRAGHHGAETSSHAPRASRRFWGTVHGATRGIVVEFGLAELLDTLVVRPLAMGLATASLGASWGVPVGKVAADTVFYTVTITSYELRRRTRARG